MDRLKHVDAFSAAKMSAAIDLVIGFIVAVFLFVIVATFSSASSILNFPLFTKGVVVLVAMPLIIAVSCFILVAIEAFLYNEIANRIGSAKIDLGRRMNRLNRIDILSTSKIAAVGGAIIGGAIGLIIAIVGLALGSARFAIIGVASIFILAIVLAIVLFVCVAVSAYIYNFVASKIGGIKLLFKGKELRRVDPMTYAKIQAVISLIFGFVAGLFRTVGYFASPVHVSAVGAFSIIIYPILYLVIGFVTSLVQAWIYNWLVPRIGGVRFTINRSR